MTYIPRWRGPVEGYAKNFVKRNLWRVEGLYEFEDGVSEAYAVFLKCRERYSGKITNPAHFMSLFKSGLRYRFIDLAKQVSYKVRPEKSDAGLESAAMVLDLLDDVSFRDRLEVAPEPVKKLFVVLREDPSRFEALHRRSGKRETTNARICRILGIDSSIDVRGLLQSFLVQA